MTHPATRTAVGPQFLAAVETTFRDHRSLTRDVLAASVLPLHMRLLARACGIPWLRDAFIGRLERRHPGGWAGIACRKRYFDEQAAAAVDAGIAAVVNLGSGFDTRAYRLSALARVPVFEVDMPENIARKRAWIARSFGAVPPHVTLVPIDFDRQDVGVLLGERGWHTDTKTLFLWEGVTQYLTAAGVQRTMASISAAASGSRLGFTYVVQDFLDGTDHHGLAAFQRSPFVRKLWHFGLRPDAVGEFLAGHGWRTLEHLGPPELEARYVRPTGRPLRVMAIERLVLAEKT